MVRVSRPTYIYRLVVQAWPTPDAAPWQRFYGPAFLPFSHTRGMPNVPDWLHELIARHRSGPDGWRVEKALREDAYGGHSVLMPVPKRAHYLSASGAHEVARDMAAFGALVDVERSEPVAWDGGRLHRYGEERAR